MARPLTDIPLYGVIDDISTAGQTYIPCPDDGEIIEIRTVLDSAITVADATLTSKIGGTAVTGGSIVVGYSGSAAGDEGSCTPSANNKVSIGQGLEIETNGGSTTAAKCYVTAILRRAYQ